MFKARILLIEDEENLGKTLTEYLTGQGYQCFWASTAAKATASFQKQKPDIILMDIGLPDGDGLELARKFRKQDKEALLLFLSALNDPDTRLEGLEIGAEDYITKPFALKELLLRLDRILSFKEKSKSKLNQISYGKLSACFKKYELEMADGSIVNLGQKEAGILRMLYEYKGEAVTRDHLIKVIWGDDKYPTNRTIDNYIVKLRKWCESDPKSGIEIQSIRGIGYKLVVI